MRLVLSAILISIIHLNISFAQCKANIEKLGSHTFIETETDLIHYKFVGNNSIWISFGNERVDDYYLILNPSLSNAWYMSKEDELVITLSNGIIFTLNPSFATYSKEYLEPLGSQYRQKAKIRCSISKEQLDVLSQVNISGLSMPALKLNTLKIKKKNQQKHWGLIQCLNEKVKTLRKKLEQDKSSA